jgi:hypothetical protein
VGMRLMRHVCRGAVPQRHTNQRVPAHQIVLLDIIIQNINVEPVGFARHSWLEFRPRLLGEPDSINILMIFAVTESLQTERDR